MPCALASRGQPHKSSGRRRRQKGRPDIYERASASPRLYTGRLLTERHEKPIPDFFPLTALDYDKIYVSAGVRGLQLEICP